MINTIAIDYQQDDTSGILTIRFNPTTHITFSVNISMNLTHEGSISILDFDGLHIAPSDESYYTSMAYNILTSGMFNYFN